MPPAELIESKAMPEPIESKDALVSENTKLQIQVKMVQVIDYLKGNGDELNISGLFDYHKANFESEEKFEAAKKFLLDRLEDIERTDPGLITKAFEEQKTFGKNIKNFTNVYVFVDLFFQSATNKLAILFKSDKRYGDKDRGMITATKSEEELMSKINEAGGYAFLSDYATEMLQEEIKAERKAWGLSYDGQVKGYYLTDKELETLNKYDMPPEKSGGRGGVLATALYTPLDNASFILGIIFAAADVLFTSKTGDSSFGPFDTNNPLYGVMGNICREIITLVLSGYTAKVDEKEGLIFSKTNSVDLSFNYICNKLSELDDACIADYNNGKTTYKPGDPSTYDAAEESGAKFTAKVSDFIFNVSENNHNHHMDISGADGLADGPALDSAA